MTYLQNEAPRLDDRCRTSPAAVSRADLTLRDRAEITDYLRRATGAAPAEGVAVLLLDLDDFRVVNDSLGHDVGDLLLTQVARRIDAQMSYGHRAVRLVGDGFLVVLPGSGASDAVELAEGLLASIEAPLHLCGTELAISSSVGIATSECVSGVDDLLGAAEVALFRAKQRGKAGIVVFRPHMLQIAKDRLALETALRRAVRNEELHVVYQPIVDLTTGALSGVEALARWHDELQGDVSPVDFIPVAERSGLILPLGEWVLRTAASCLQHWNAQAPGHRLTLNVNVSPRQLERHGFVPIVDELLASGLDPAQLVLEITETALARDDDAVTATLHALRQRGIRLAVDDFGTGYSSLSRLRSSPVSQLKIDRSFISEITHAGADAPIVDATVAMAVGLGLGVIAEGVESLEQLHYLRRLGCGQAQGFLLARPTDAHGIGRMLAGRPPWADMLLDGAVVEHRPETVTPPALDGGRVDKAMADEPLQGSMDSMEPSAVVTAAETIAAVAAAEVAAEAAATARAAVTVACAAALKAATKAEAVAADAATAAAAAASMLRGASGSPDRGSPRGAGAEPGGGARSGDAVKAAVAATADAAAAAVVKVAVRVEHVAAAAATATVAAAALIETQLIETVAAAEVALAAPTWAEPDADRCLGGRSRSGIMQVGTGTLILTAPDAPRVARRAVAEHCRMTATGAACSEAAVLLTSEVVTNAVLHGSGVVRMRLESDTRRIRVEVDDDDRQAVFLTAAADDAEGGRGMLMVDALSSDWGVTPTARGKTVWFEVRTRL